MEEEIWGDERGAPSPPRPHIRGSDFSTPWWRSLRLSRFSFTFPCREKSERKRIGGEAASWSGKVKSVGCSIARVPTSFNASYPPSYPINQPTLPLIYGTRANLTNLTPPEKGTIGESFSGAKSVFRRAKIYRGFATTVKLRWKWILSHFHRQQVTRGETEIGSRFSLRARRING